MGARLSLEEQVLGPPGPAQRRGIAKAITLLESTRADHREQADGLLTTLLPHTGGSYVILRAAYGDAAAFVFGWLYLLVATPAAIGALATFFAELLLGVLGAGAGGWRIPAIAAVTILSLTVVNLLGARLGSAVQTFLTVVKVGALLVLILFAFGAGGGSVSHLAPAGGPLRNLGSGAAIHAGVRDRMTLYQEGMPYLLPAE